MRSLYNDKLNLTEEGMSIANDLAVILGEYVDARMSDNVDIFQLEHIIQNELNLIISSAKRNLVVNAVGFINKTTK